ncbi:hypothetical protein C8Q72DRAFT_791581 [Fomitopsis betulina]|nr:hypothetical protein C8Q72DRAFT_791581 [Fomitopsis betulina]
MPAMLRARDLLVLCFLATRQQFISERRLHVPLSPDKITAVIGAAKAVLYLPPDQLYHAQPDSSALVSLGVTPSFACAEIDVDIRRTLRATLRNTLTLHRSLCYNGKSFLGAGDGVKEIGPIPFFTQEEEEYWVEPSKAAGIVHYASSPLAIFEADLVVIYTPENQKVPVFSILADPDTGADCAKFFKLLGSANFLLNWEMRLPVVFSRFVKKWLKKLLEKLSISATESRIAEETHARPYDEL